MAQNPVLSDIGHGSAESNGQQLYSQYVNPIRVKLLDVLGMNVRYICSSGAELYTDDRRVILDCLSGYCVHNAGHNHPHIVAKLVAESQSQTPAMLQSNVVESAGQLASHFMRACWRQSLEAFFCSSGREAIEAVIKFARAHTERNDIVYAAGVFHGLTGGALSLMGNDFWREGFGPMLDGTHEVPSFLTFNGG